MKNKTLFLGLCVVALLIVSAVLFWNRYGRAIIKHICNNTNTTTTTSAKCIDGIDISHHNGIIDFKTIAANNDLQFVYIKATEGSTHKDSKYKHNVKNAKRQGLNVGAYHFFTMGSSAQKQFDNFKNTVKKNEINLIPMVDVETYVNRRGYHIGDYYLNNRKQKQQVIDSLQELLDKLEKHYGKKPMIYCNEGSYKHLIQNNFSHYNIYYGDYSYKCNISDYTIWQYSERGFIKGIKKHVDVAQFSDKASVQDILL